MTKIKKYVDLLLKAYEERPENLKDLDFYEFLDRYELYMDLLLKKAD